ncbi:MAG: hypothetical protein JSR53_15865 [Proteobacteria bacterium]|nr:hypothetical protein [Pseudomonadota bacterium]
MSRASDVLGLSAPVWLSGKTYYPGEVVKSPADRYQTYVRTSVAGAGAIDPSADTSNYVPFGARAIKSIQRGVMAGNATATITAVAPSKTELRCLGSIGQWASVDGANRGAIAARIALTNATTITSTMQGLESSNGTVSWELTEYF